MIDTRLCRSQEELKNAMSYEHNKALLSNFDCEAFKLQIKIDQLSSMLSQMLKEIDQLQKEVDKFETQYNYMIVKEEGDASHVL